ncbi:MAG: 1-aminocyclopropane-1-carboxylate deaminase [Bacteroidetes bacterium MedPE-SWsnd-G1]|nr:MAG: 1-aminocyclopropane-1-carboxylate deaminase [Bacteroidetes bacterium MedPE-SWsnd-G1]
MPNVLNSVIQKVQFSEIEKFEVSFSVKREDLIHPEISGNKFRKLKFNIQQALKENHSTILTYGGAYSNHIAATAAVGKIRGIKTIGVIRGEELGKDLNKTVANNKTLKFAHDSGMIFHFVSRSDYKLKHSKEFLKGLENKFGTFYNVPEGGTNKFAVKGCEEILDSYTQKFDTICTAVGTGGTISGLINTAKKHQNVIGFPALKGDFFVKEIQPYITNKTNWELISDYHFGGYARTSESLIRFINNFKKETNIQLDPIYTGKMVFGIVDLIKKGYFAKGSKILAIHTGGLQGIDGINTILKKNNSLIIR